MCQYLKSITSVMVKKSIFTLFKDAAASDVDTCKESLKIAFKINYVLILKCLLIKSGTENISFMAQTTFTFVCTFSV